MAARDDCRAEAIVLVLASILINPLGPIRRLPRVRDWPVQVPPQPCEPSNVLREPEQIRFSAQARVLEKVLTFEDIGRVASGKLI